MPSDRTSAADISRRALLLSAAATMHARTTPRARSITLRSEVTIPETLNAPLNLWLPVPQSNADQTISQLRVTGAPHQLHTGTGGNRYCFASVPPAARVVMEFRATRQQRSTAFPPARRAALPAPQCCLAPDRLVPIDGKIRQWAEDVVRQAGARTELEKARAIYEYVVATVKYDKSGKGWGRGDIYYACDARRGNCTDFHAIFIGYTRAVGIPAKFVIGLPLPAARTTGTAAEISGYHCWAEFFTPEAGWVPVDASEAAKDPARRNFFFGSLDENRVEFTRGRDLVLTPKQSSAPLNFFVAPYAELNGRPFEQLQSRVLFADIA